MGAGIEGVGRVEFEFWGAGGSAVFGAMFVLPSPPSLPRVGERAEARAPKRLARFRESASLFAASPVISKPA